MVDLVILSERFDLGARRGPEWLTDVTPLSGGNEQRGQRWEESRLVFDLSYAPMPLEDARQIEAMFYARRGRARSYLVRDPLDYVAQAEPLGTGDGTRRDFQLVRVYEPAGVPYARPIRHIKGGTLTVYLNGVATTAYSLLTGGIVRLTTAPAAGVVVAASFEFYVPVRFDMDQLEVELMTPTVARVRDLRLVEVRE
jgi:uncharacterized protein (TIGR02217 family)